MRIGKTSKSGGGLTFLLIFMLLTAGIIAGGYFAYCNYARHFRAEAEANLSGIVALAGLLILSTAAGVGLLWRQQRIRMYQERAEASDALRASEVRYRRLFEAAKYGILILDAETGLVLDVNPYLLALLDYSREEIIGKKVWELGFFKDLRANQNNFTELQQKEYVRYEDMALEAHDGTRREVEFVSNVYQANHHKTIQCNIRDISERKQAEEALLKSENTLRTLIEELPDIVSRLDSEGRILFMSENISRMTDLETMPFIGKTHRELGFPEAHCRFWEENVRRVFENNAPFEIETTLDGRYGSAIYNCRFVPERDAQKTIRAVLTISRDITKHRRSEKNYQMLFREMLNGFALHEIICDAQGRPTDYRFLDVNPAFERITGLQAQQILGKTVTEVLPGTEQHWIEAYGKVARTGEPIFFENYSAPIQKHFEVTAFRPALNQFACIVADITERKRLEAEQAKTNQDLRDALQSLQDMQAQALQQTRLSALGQLASGISHDFNNILMPILGYSELLLSNPATLDNRDKALDAIKRIHRAAGDARQITRRLRWIYRPDDEASFLPVDMNEVAREVLAMTQPRWDMELGAQGIRIRTATRLEARAPVMGDVSQLREVLMNLILNAVDAMPQGGILTLASAEEREQVVLCVTDTGIGMTDEAKARCQEVFFTSKGAVKGSGLGLTIVASIMSRHKGTLEVESALGRGTTIRLRLPRAPAGTEIAAPVQALAAERPAPTSGRILLAEDDVEVLNLLDHVLKSAGHIVETAQNGREAIAKVRGGTYDLVITDRAMPGANGDEVALAVQAHTPATPVILLSGFGYLMTVKGERPPGVTRVCSKPISPQDLVQVVQDVMDADRQNPV